MNAVVTGATKGIGRAIAETLLQEGINIAVCARNDKELMSMQKELQLQYPKQEILIFKADISKKAEVIAFATFVKNVWKQVDILINNAGVFLPGMIHHEEEGVLEKLIETNLYSAYHLTRALIPMMIAQGKGHVFNMCSVASIKAYPNGGSYSISKFALLGFNKVLREELKDKGIKVTAILPGATWSDSWSGVDLPKERLMQANDIAIAIVQCLKMSNSAVVEEIVIRPQLGDL